MDRVARLNAAINEQAQAVIGGDRPWGPGDNPKTAVWEYLKTHPEFEIDKSRQEHPAQAVDYGGTGRVLEAGKMTTVIWI